MEVHDFPGSYIKLVMATRDEENFAGESSDECSTTASIRSDEFTVQQHDPSLQSSDDEPDATDYDRAGRPGTLLSFDDDEEYSLVQGLASGVLTRSHPLSHEKNEDSDMSQDARNAASQHATSSSNGRHPTDVHASTTLGRRIEETNGRQHFRRLHLREIANQHTRILGQEQITQEFLNLADLTEDGRVRLHLHGLKDREVRVERLRVDTGHIRDFLDLIIIMRDMWNDVRGTLDHDVYFVSPQPPPVMQEGAHIVTLIIDLEPAPREVPILVVTKLDQVGYPDTYHAMAYRTDGLVSCEYLKEISGLTMICVHNAHCICTHENNRIDETRLVPIRGGEMVLIIIYFDLARCDVEHEERMGNTTMGDFPQDTEDESTFMQLQRPPEVRPPFEMPWLYGYGLGLREPSRAWRHGSGGMPAVPYLSTIYARQIGHILHNEAVGFRVTPQPSDITRMSAEAFVLAPYHALQPRQSLILLDASWEYLPDPSGIWHQFVEIGGY